MRGEIHGETLLHSLRCTSRPLDAFHHVQWSYRIDSFHAVLESKLGLGREKVLREALSYPDGRITVCLRTTYTVLRHQVRQILY